MGDAIAEFVDLALEQFDRLTLGSQFEAFGRWLGRTIHGGPEGPGAGASSAPSIAPATFVQGASGTVRVVFENTPRTVRVDPERASGDLELDVGYGLAGA